MGLVDLIKDAAQERRDLEDKLRGFAILDAGFDQAWTAVLDRTYDGPADAEAVKAFAAQEYGIGDAPAQTNSQDDQ